MVLHLAHHIAPASIVRIACLLTGWLFMAAAVAQQINAGPYVPSPQSVVADMLKVAGIGPGDFVIDLGSGDGRIVLTAAKVYGARGFGVEIQDDLVKLSNEAAKNEGLADRVKFIKQDLFKTDISQATVLTMYLLPNTVNMLSDKLQAELKPGTRILSHDYGLSGWIPEETKVFDLEDKIKISGVTTTIIYLYVVPAKVEGRWTVKVGRHGEGRRSRSADRKCKTRRQNPLVHAPGRSRPPPRIQRHGRARGHRRDRRGHGGTLCLERKSGGQVKDRGGWHG